MKRILILSAIAVFCLTACKCRNGAQGRQDNPGSPDGQSITIETYQDNLAMALSEGQVDSLLFDVSLEYASGGLSDKAKSAMNSAIIQQAFDLDEVDGSLEEVAIRYRENLVDEYFSENTGNGPYDSTWEDSISGEFTGSYKNWVNYTFVYYSYRGGAHAFKTTTQLVFDKNTGALLTEDDFFAEGYKEPVSELLREAVRTALSAYNDETLSLVEMENVVPNGNFSVGEDGIQWFFRTYEIMSLVLGSGTTTIPCTVPWEKLNPYLK
ncbi:MAG: hypothetical protein IK008_04345 [Bacteroidales bacterium]|nr:hypothetical protein [Bacteroidales bacterium]